MHILFLHSNFSAQFRHLATALAQNPQHQVVLGTAQGKIIASILQSLIHTMQTHLKIGFRPHLQLHPYGYGYAPIVCNRLIELLILQWSAGAQSKPHSHGASINFTKILSGQVLERKYHLSGGELRIISERVMQAGQWAWTLPFEIHELIALNSSSETLHIYFPGRVN